MAHITASTSLSIDVVRSGHFVQGAALAAVISANSEPFLQRGAEELVLAVQETSPVKTGALRAGWHPNEVSYEGSTLYIGISNDVVYANYQNWATRNRGYIERGQAAGQQRVVAQLEAAAHAIAAGLWVAE